MPSLAPRIIIAVACGRRSVPRRGYEPPPGGVASTSPRQKQPSHLECPRCQLPRHMRLRSGRARSACVARERQRGHAQLACNAKATSMNAEPRQQQDWILKDLQGG
jgi:hypothetical protein